MFLYCFTLFNDSLLLLYHVVKLHRKPLFTLQTQVYMVECSRLIVNGYQIWVDGCFLDFQVISTGEIGNNKINIGFIRFGERYFCSCIFNIANRISSMDSGYTVFIYDVAVMNPNKRKRQDTFKMFQCFESSDYFAIFKMQIC